MHTNFLDVLQDEEQKTTLPHHVQLASRYKYLGRVMLLGSIGV